MARPDVPGEDGRIGGLLLRVGDGDRIFVDVETDTEKRRLSYGCSPVLPPSMRAGCHTV